MATTTPLFPSAVIFVGITCGLPAAAAPLLATNMPDIFSYPAPPAGFDAFRASPAELESYGFPPRPDVAQRAARASWEMLVKAARTRIQPVLQPSPVVAGPARRAARPINSVAPGATNYSTNWSGEVLQKYANGYGSGAFSGLVTTFNVPVASQAFGACTGNWDYLVTWDGIDGWDTTDVFQAGTESDAYCSNNSTQQFYSAWVEWYPGSSTRISNLPVTAGDAMLVWMIADGPTTGRAIIVNQTSGQTVIMSLTAPSGVTLRGDSAEWIVERPTVNNNPATMTNYVQAWMSNETAAVIGNAQNGNYGAPPPGANALLVTMLNANNGPVISSVVPAGASAAVFSDSGPAKN
jgi:hypothetical protein